MPRFLLPLSALLLGLSALPLQAQDHLVPAGGYFSSYAYAHEYHSQVRETLLKNLSEHPVLRVVVLPSFEQEYVLSLEQNKLEFTLRCVRSCGSIWAALQQKQPLPSTDGHVAALSADAARAIAAAFTAAIDQTHYPSPDIKYMRSDGVTYHFASFRNGLGLREGTTWSPAPGSTLAALVQLTEQLQQFALQRADRPKEAELVAAARSISAKLAAPPTVK